MISLATNPLTSDLARALLHFLWQGALIGAITFAFWRIRRVPPGARYASGVLALALMLAAPVATTAYLVTRDGARNQAPTEIALAPASDTTLVVRQETSIVSTPSGPVTTAGGRVETSTLSTVILLAWLLGVTALSLRLFGGWIVARRLAVRSVRPVSAEIAVIARRVAARLAIDRIVSVLESSSVSVPVMVGWLKPVVLIPSAVVAGLSPLQIEALLAHELAHVRRHDYLVNLLQAVVETLLFYHPAVWWVSRQVRADREHCCDDLVISICDRLTYATALTDLAAMTRPRVALAATDGSLLDRVKRILGQPSDEGRTPGGWMPALLIIIALGALAPTAVVSSEIGQPSGRGQTAVPARAPGAVVGGVVGGISGGVPGGVAGGVPGGIPGGVPGGVAGGVQGGVPGGVQGGVVSRASVATGSVEQVAVAQTSEQSTELEFLKMQIAAREQFLAMQRKIERERVQLKMQRLDSEHRGQTAELQGQLKLLRSQLESTKAKVGLGVAPKDALLNLEQELMATQARLASLQDDRALAAKEFELQAREAEQQAEFEMRQMQLELKIRELELARKNRERVEGVMVDELRSGMEARRAEEKVAAVEFTAAAVEFTAADDQSRALRSGDRLRIEIHGEPDLPPVYSVSQAGTIRLPFLGTMRVVGRTAAEVQRDIARTLVDRKLIESPAVEVTLLRGARQESQELASRR